MARLAEGLARASAIPGTPHKQAATGEQAWLL
jgi:hypothetical protein